MEVLLLQNYNTRVVVLASACLGIAAGLAGTFLLLRKRALVSDSIAHSTLPGVVLAFLLLNAAGGDTRSTGWLLMGASLSGIAGGLLIMGLHSFTRIREDAAMGISLSMFFAAGIALLGIVQSIPSASAAGISSLIYGKAASMVLEDAGIIGLSTLVILAMTLLLFKELRLLCFDAAYARSQGWPATLLDALLLGMVVLVTVVGLKAVGLILIIAFLIIPAAAAKLWVERLSPMLLLSAAFGALAGWLGSTLSAVLENLPTGPAIVLISSFFFGCSFIASRIRESRRAEA